MLPSQGAQQSAPEDLPSDDSSDPNGHDLGFLSLPHDSVPYMYDADGTSSKESCAQRKPSVMQDSSGAHGGMRQQSHAGSGCSADGCDELGGGGRRRRGRPVGSKDRQPRVKRMAFSPQPSDNGDKNSVGESEARRKPWKIILTAEQAVEIYKKRSIGANMDSTSSCRSNEVAEQYGVNSKTIRDIWNRATWVKATRSEWNEQEEAMYIASQTNSNSTPLEGDAAQLGTGADKKGSSAQKRTRGRPKGSRGLRPHVKRGQGSRYVRAPPDIALCNDDERQRVLNEGVPLVLSTLADDQEGDDVIHYQMCCVGEDFDKIDADEDLVLACLLSEHEANLSPTSSEPITADSSSAASIQGTRRKRGRPSKSAFKTSAQQPAATPAPSSEAAQHVMAMMMSGLEQLVKAGRTRMLDIPTQHMLTPQTPDEARHRQRDQSPLSVLSLAAAADVAGQEG